jgi:hypothetical protein
MEEAAENGKELSHSARGNGMNYENSDNTKKVMRNKR